MKVLWNSLILFVIVWSSAGQAKAGLLINGDFETGDFTGWTKSGNTVFPPIATSPAHAGTFAASFGPVGSEGFISQTIATIVGHTYKIDAWLQNPGGTPNEFSVDFEDARVIDLINLPAQDYTLESVVATATSTSTVVRFGFRQDPGFFRFDDASVTDLGDPPSVPEPSALVLSLILLGVFGTTWMRRRSTQTTAAA